MTTEPEPQAPPIALEWVDLTAVGLDPEAPVATDLMTWCATALGMLALDVSNVQLVVTGDFVESVKQRSTSEHQQQTYDVRRNSGLVGAKTMALADGRIDVIVPAWWFSVYKTDEQRRNCEQLAKRTIVHEAYHVVMAQAGEANGSYEGEPWARHNFLNVADQVINEYRAEAAIGPALRVGDDAWDCIDVLITLSGDLKRIVDEYQTHLDVSQLSYQIGQEAHTAWKILAYVAAEQLRDDGGFEALPEDIITHPLWQRMIGSHWQQFLELLAVVPPASDRVKRADLETSIAGLATKLQAWLETIGFQFIDNEDGTTVFYIVEWDLLSDSWSAQIQ